jgi:hypothetical protein
VVVVLLEERFFVLEDRSVDFLDVDFADVLVGFETVLLAVLAGVLLAVFTAGLLVGRDGDAPDREAVFAAAVPVDAIASIRGAVFLAGPAARTSRIALVCSSSVIRNS